MTSQDKSQTILQDELNGFYTIGRNINDLATLPSEQQLTDVVLLPPSAREAPGQRWEVTRTPRGTYTITNRGISLSFEGEPKLYKTVKGISDVREWSLYKAADPFSYHVVVPGGPIDQGKELAFDRSRRLIQPPETELNYLNVEDQSQAWIFTRDVF
ncbi:hypothetical protein BJV77DRAFT_1019284 [Russula vinacea]|nr:hypothetical protein BJV77DRAFT_1019284 [Russula vinacea]